jgi:ribosomal protein S18 acetylase RimI-like enzyme
LFRDDSTKAELIEEPFNKANRFLVPRNINTKMIEYHHDKKITTDQFIDVLNRSTLGERRPVNDRHRIEKMLENCNLLITAWDNEKLIGVSRSITDFTYCCYLSDLAVDVAYQKQGIGKELIRITKEQCGEKTTLILLSAPAAVNYYPKIGMERFTDCFLIRSK